MTLRPARRPGATGPWLRRRGLLAAAPALLPAAPTAARAQEAWPSRPIRLIVPCTPGGASDFIGRVVGERMARALGQPVVVESRPGAGGNLGTEAGARATPDGHTIRSAPSARWR